MLMFEIEEKEMVDHPSHYNQGIEAIDYIESHNMNFNIGNVIKYITIYLFSNLCISLSKYNIDFFKS